jgi:hypothetical protein
MVKYTPQEMFRYSEVEKKQIRTIMGNDIKNPMYTLKDQNI